jgi:hypothetical protein
VSIDNQEVGRWLQIASNIGILGGLILVGFQLHQNSEILKTQVMTDESRRTVEQEWLLVGEEGARVWAKSIERPNDLDLQERRIMDSILWTGLENFRHTHRLSTQGLVDIDWKSRVSDEAGYYYGNPYGRGWWNNMRNGTVVPQDLKQVINEALESSPNSTLDYYSSMMKEIQILTNTSKPPECVSA